MPRQPLTGDRNFDDLSERFSRNVYGGLKGRIRLSVLRRDFGLHLPIPPFVPHTGQPPWRILDAGGGQGQFSIPLARAGHTLTLCDLSSKMLAQAAAEAGRQAIADRVTFLQTPIQSLGESLPAQEEAFDLVICHAVLEWVLEPQTVLEHLLRWLKPGGYLSLSYYNLHGAIYKNLLRTNYRKVEQGDHGGFRGSLSPINPLYPETVDEWLAALPLERLSTSGIRVFHDYILDRAEREKDPDKVVALELALSQREPYRSLGRYMHVLLKRTH